jgi:hypothetical protein
MHQAAMRSLGILENEIMGEGAKSMPTSYREKQREDYKHKATQSESSESSEEERRQKRKEDTRNIIAQT